MKRWARVITAMVIIVGLWSGAALADSFTFTIGQDNMLVSYRPTTSYSNYSVNYQWGKPGREIQTLIRFDDIIGDNPGQVPLGSTINNAMLRFYVYNGSGRQRDVYQMTADWDGSSTWNSMGGGVDIATQTTGSPVASYTHNSGGFFGIDVSASLQSWADGNINYGWVITGSASDSYDWSALYALSNKNLNLRPTLSVDFTKPSGGVPEPGSMLLMGSALAGLAAWRARRRKKSPKT